MSSLLTTLPSLGFRSAGGLSSRLGCHALGDRGTNAVPWVTRQQIRFVSSDDEVDHYATLRVERTDPPVVINKAWTQRTKETHSDLAKGKDNTAFLKVAAAGQILRNPEKKAKYDEEYDRRQKAKQAKAAEQQRAGDMLRAAALRKKAAQLREEAERVKAAEENKRNEERKAKELADRAARRAEAEKQKQADAERQKKAAEESPEEKAEKAAIRAAKAAEKKEAEEEDARKAAKAAELRQAAVKARKAELAKRRQKEARTVVFRHVPLQALLWDVTQGLQPLKPGRILDSGVGRGTAWVELWTDEQARALHRTVTETDQFAICGKTILNSAIFQGHARPPSGPGLITRCLYIIIHPGFLGRETNVNELVRRKLRERGFSVSPAGYRSGSMLIGSWLVQEYASVAHAQSAKAAIERHYPDYLNVDYIEDPCGGLTQTAQEGAGAESGSDKETSDDFRFLPSTSEIVLWAFLALIALLWDIKTGKPSYENTQKNKQDESQSGP